MCAASRVFGFGPGIPRNTWPTMVSNMPMNSSTRARITFSERGSSSFG
jgi:hypothetical protein